MKKSITLSCLLLAASLSIPFANAYFAVTKTQTINVHDRYSINLPTYLTKAGDLNMEASLQYQNIYKEVYMIIIDESTEEFVKTFRELNDYDTTKSALENYANAQMTSVRSEMSKIISESEPRKIKTQSGEAIVYDVSAFQDGIEDEMGFTVALMQGKQCLYMFMTWTFAKTKSVYQADMDNMVASFKELSGALDTYPHYFATPKYSIEFPYALVSDTSTCSENCIGLSRAKGSLCVAISEFEQTEWKKAYATWPDRKTYSMLEYFSMDQKNFQAKNAPLGTTHSELKKTKTNGAPSCIFSRTEPATDEYISWYYESVIVQTKNHFIYIYVYCPVDQLDQNRPEIDAMFTSFKVK